MTNIPAPSVIGAPECIWPAGANLGEGTLWSRREQALYWIDILTPRLFWFRPADGARRTWQFDEEITAISERATACLLYTSPSPRDRTRSRMPSSA